jgi:hypothetical protein
MYIAKKKYMHKVRDNFLSLDLKEKARNLIDSKILEIKQDI